MEYGLANSSGAKPKPDASNKYHKKLVISIRPERDDDNIHQRWSRLQLTYDEDKLSFRESEMCYPQNVKMFVFIQTSETHT